MTESFAAASPSEKSRLSSTSIASRSSNRGWMTSLPVASTYPHFESWQTAAIPSDMARVLSNRGATTILPCRSMSPQRPFERIG
ncbi:MAG: hypothetical protein HY815_00055 [Candidatus Riflebacteria bacterium]|nr:hypothetical protein [Candidatus Riflebacteria bacterium]